MTPQTPGALPARVRPREAGFTLIEVLVVVIIIGILSAIAIPRFISQEQKAVDGSLKADARNLGTHLEAFWLDTGAYPAAPTEIAFVAPVVTVGDDAVTVSRDNTPRVFVGGEHAVCVQVTNPRATDPATGYVWTSDGGGLQPNGSTCAAYVTPLL